VDFKDLDKIKLRNDLDEDKKNLDYLLAISEAVIPKIDAKLKELKKEIKHKVENNLNQGNRKIIVFTAFADTNNLPVITYLDENSLENDATQKGYCHLMGGKGKINTMAQTIDSLGRHNPEALYSLYKNYNPKNGKDIPKSFQNWAIVGNAEVFPLEDLTI
jgi:hypothetical protein